MGTVPETGYALTVGLNPSIDDKLCLGKHEISISKRPGPLVWTGPACRSSVNEVASGCGLHAMEARGLTTLGKRTATNEPASGGQYLLH